MDNSETTTTFTPVEAVANFFIEKGIDNKNPLTQLQIQKLVFISHGWYLGIYNKNLIDEDFEAWQFGPVVRELYEHLKVYKNNKVTSKISKEEAEFDDGVIKKYTTTPVVKGEKIVSHLEIIWDTHGGLSGAQLVNITHQKNSPWYAVYVEMNRYKGRISNNLIQQYYKELSVNLSEQKQQTK
ncbi:MAG: Panacea domain-containing protein [Spirosomataceae bacterium]